jgi:hypothetical protein
VEGRGRSKTASKKADEVIADLKWKFVSNFLDGLVVYSNSLEEYGDHVREVLGRLEQAGFTLNPEKMVLGVSQIKYLGHLISSKGIEVLPDRIAALQKYPGRLI